jgi:hypothetical protein
VTEARRSRAEAALAEARRLLDAGDAHGALRLLERARKDFLQAEDLTGLRELRRTIEESYRHAETADEPRFERLLYSSAQNIRYLSRRKAGKAGVPWEDPHPELEQPGRPEMRAERGITRHDRRWIALAVVLGVAVVAAVAVGIVAVYRAERLVLVNDTSTPVDVGVCDSRTCDTVKSIVTVDPGERYTALGHDFLLTTATRRLGCIHAHGTTRRMSTAVRC